MLKLILRIAAKVLTIALLVFMLAAAYGGYVNPQLWATPAILTLILPYLAILVLIMAVVWALSRRLIMAAICVVTLVACWGSISSVLPFGSEKKPESPAAARFSIMTYNMYHGLNCHDKEAPAGATARYILNSGADIVVLQEFAGLRRDYMPTTPASVIDSLKSAYPYVLSDARRYFGILSKYPVEYAPVIYSESYFDCVYTVNIRGKKLTIANMHLASYKLSDDEYGVLSRIKSPRSADNSFRELKGSIMAKMKESFRNRAREAMQVREQIASISGPLILCGDFNDVPSSWAYRTIRGEDFNDAYTETNFGYRSTYYAHRMHFHIDQILYRGAIRALSVKREKEGESDHYPLVAQFEFTQPQ